MLFVILEKYFENKQKLYDILGCSENSWYKWKRKDLLPEKRLKIILKYLGVSEDIEITDLMIYLIEKDYNK